MLKSRTLFLSLIIGLFSLSSCGVIPHDEDPKGPPIPVNPEDGGGDDGPIDPIDPIDPGVPGGEEEYVLTVTDKSSHYYVGETFVDVSRLQIIYKEDGKETDVSSRISSFVYVMKDKDGKDFDPSKPFTEAGTYSCQIQLKNNTKLCSEFFDVVVDNSPSKELINKTTIPNNFTYYDFENSCRENYSFPSKGNINALVVPVEISDFPFTSSAYGSDYLSAITKAFKGNGVDDTGYWESVSSYYRKTSKNALNFNFEIADVYKCGKTSAQMCAGGEGSAFYMAEYVIEDYKAKRGASSTQRFDNDNDGYIDGLWMVYSAPDYVSYSYGSSGASVFWAFCSDLNDDAPNISSPTVNSFGWASISFLSRGAEAPKVDAHTFIHETGHLLSLPDYYSYDRGSNSTSGPQGGLAMMDYNVGDQDSFSKISLGWAHPYYPTEDCVITLKPNESTGDCLLLADSWNGTAFDEYILLDLQTPTGLNKLDSEVSYEDSVPKYYSETGVRMYHIDARLGQFKYAYSEDDVGISGTHPVKDETQTNYYLNDDQVKNLVTKGRVPVMTLDKNVLYENRNPGTTVINANSPSRCLIQENEYKNNRLITLVGADNKQPEIDECYASNASLFKEGDSWTANAKTSKFFTKGEAKFNNGDNFSYVISVLKCNSEEAKIQIRKL